jgi:PAS domain S-box-containing protein
MAPVLWALATLALGLSIAAAGYFQALAAQGARDQSRVHRYRQRAHLAILARLGAYEDILHGAWGLLSAKPDLEGVGWESYGKRLDLQGHAGVRSLARIVRVPKGELPDFLRNGLKEGTLYQIHPFTKLLPQDGPMILQAPDHLVIQWVYPQEDNPRALGLDVGSSPTQREAAERAVATGNPTLTGKLVFTDLKPQETAVALLNPVFRGTGVPATAQERLARQDGWVSLAIMLDRFFPEILKENDDSIGLRVDDVIGDQVWPLYLDPSLRNHPEAKWQGAQREDLRVGGRTWRLTCVPLPSMYRDPGRNRGGAWIFGGGMVSLLLAAVAWFLVGTRELAEDRANRMTLGLQDALQHFKSHIENTPFAVIQWDAGGVIRDWNPAAEAIFGYLPSAILGQGPEFLDLEGSSLLAEGLKRALDGQGNRTALELRSGNGGHIPCICHHTVVKGQDGRITGVLTLLEDQREIRKAEEALRLGQKLESLGVLAGGIAHDFNNLLAGITGNAELALERSGTSDRARAHLERILATARRAAHLARQMLAYAGKAPFEVKVVDLDRELEEILDLLQASLPKLVCIKLECGADGATILADPTQIQQVVVNLVTNGAEAIGDGREGCVRVATARVDLDAALLASLIPGHNLAPGPAVMLSVEDDGAGMDPDILARIFDPFFTTKFPGRGLGLSALLGILRSHGAGLSVSTGPGQGAAFRIYFPESSWPAGTAKPAVEELPPGRGTVLFADDEPTLRELTKDLLESRGYQVVLARDGVEAVETFRGRQDICLVVLDLTMPRMGGLDAFRIIRGENPRMKVILASGYTVEDIQDRSGPQPDGFLHKPFAMKELLAMVADLCGPRG